MTGKTFGELLKELREARGYSMNQLALKTRINVSHISRLESEKRSAPKLNTIQKLASVLGNHEELLAAAGYTPSRKTWYKYKNADDLIIRESYKEIEEQWPEGLEVLLRAHYNLNPDERKRVLRIIKAFIEEAEGETPGDK